MNASLAESETAQVNSTHRCRHEFEKNQFKPVQLTTVSLKYKRAVYALLKEKKFLKTEYWSKELDTLQHNILCSATKDELTENCGNDCCISQSLLDEFRRNYPENA